MQALLTHTFTGLGVAWQERASPRRPSVDRPAGSLSAATCLRDRARAMLLGTLAAAHRRRRAALRPERGSVEHDSVASLFAYGAGTLVMTRRGRRPVAQALAAGTSRIPDGRPSRALQSGRAPDADCQGNELRPRLLPALPHRARWLRPAPQGPVAARHPRRRLDAPDRRPRAADARRTPSAPWRRCSTEPTSCRSSREDGEVDFSYSIPGLARFRFNAFRQRGSVSLVVRAIPVSIKTIDELSLPPVIRELAEEERGIMLLTGTTGSGKSTTLAAMIDHINSTAPAPHRDGRGSDRVPPRATRSRSSTSARSAWTPARSSARCAASCARTPTSSSSARCATRRRSTPR